MLLRASTCNAVTTRRYEHAKKSRRPTHCVARKADNETLDATGTWCTKVPVALQFLVVAFFVSATCNIPRFSIFLQQIPVACNIVLVHAILCCCILVCSNYLLHAMSCCSMQLLVVVSRPRGTPGHLPTTTLSTQTSSTETTTTQHKGRCQEEKKDEGIVKMNKSKAESISSWCHQRQALLSPTPGGINQAAHASSLELDLPRVRGVPVEGGSAGRSDRKRGPFRSPGRHSMDEEEDDDVGGVVP